jgi:hypothetical protein
LSRHLWTVCRKQVTMVQVMCLVLAQYVVSIKSHRNFCLVSSFDFLFFFKVTYRKLIFDLFLFNPRQAERGTLWLAKFQRCKTPSAVGLQQQQQEQDFLILTVMF